MKPPMHKAGPATKKRAAKTPPSMPMPGAAHDEMKYRAQDALRDRPAPASRAEPWREG